MIRRLRHNHWLPELAILAAVGALASGLLAFTAIPLWLDIRPWALGFGVLALLFALLAPPAGRARKSLRIVTGAIGFAIVLSAAWGLWFTHQVHALEWQSPAGDHQGILYQPRSTGPFPGLLMVAPREADRRADFRVIARRFSNAGFAVLLWTPDADTLAATGDENAAKAISEGSSALGARTSVDADCLGLWGNADAEWPIARMLESTATHPHFLILQSPSAMPADKHPGNADRRESPTLTTDLTDPLASWQTYPGAILFLVPGRDPRLDSEHVRTRLRERVATPPDRLQIYPEAGSQLVVPAGGLLRLPRFPAGYPGDMINWARARAANC